MVRRKFSDQQEIEIERQYREEEVSCETLGRRWGCSSWTIWNIIRKRGETRTYKEAGNTESCLELQKQNNSTVRGEMKGEKHPMFGVDHSGKNCPAWKGGRWKDDGNYIHIYSPKHPNCNHQGYVLEHRLIMEAHLGRFLTEEEVVHHINEIPDDNRIENLQLFESNGEHISFHRRVKI
jgi:hypothetical protein